MTKIAAIQMTSSDEIQENLEAAARLIEDAVRQGAKLVVLPENFALLGADKLREAGDQEVRDDGPIRHWLSTQAKQRQVWLIAGSVPMSVLADGQPVDKRVRSACFVFDDAGNEVSRYDKIHLFDVDVNDRFGSYRESDTIEPGDTAVVVDTPYGRVGLSICYDLRFPELFRLLAEQGVDIVTVPSAFTATTGAAHWEPLLRARAIENLCYVVGANQAGQHSPNRETHGQSMIVDPWGVVLAERVEKTPGVVVAEIDLDYLAEVRRRMPIAEHRRL